MVVRSNAVLRAVLVRVANYLTRQGAHDASKDLMESVRKYFPIFG